METSPRTTAEITRYVARDTLATLVSLPFYTLFVVWLIGWVHGFAVLLFWCGAVLVGLRALQIAFLLLSTVIIFFARFFVREPIEDANMTVPMLVRLIEFGALLLAIFYLYGKVYP